MNDKKVEKLDLDILKILSRDGRSSHRSMAKDLVKSHLTIKNHVDDLEKNGIIKGYSANIDLEKLGYDIIAIIELTISKGKMMEVEREIAQKPNIFGVYDVTGKYDAIIIARFRARSELSQMVKIINKSEYVIRTNTHLVLNVIKERATLADLLDHKEMAHLNPRKFNFTDLIQQEN